MCATDPIWSLKVYTIQKVVTKPDEPVVYYLFDGPKQGFVRVLVVILEGLRVDAVIQHPALVVICAQPELALLVGVHGAVLHAEAPVGCHVSTAFEGPLVLLPAQLVLALVHTLGGHLGLPTGLVLHIVALAA